MHPAVFVKGQNELEWTNSYVNMTEMRKTNSSGWSVAFIIFLLYVCFRFPSLTMSWTWKPNLSLFAQTFLRSRVILLQFIRQWNRRYRSTACFLSFFFSFTFPCKGKISQTHRHRQDYMVRNFITELRGSDFGSGWFRAQTLCICALL